MLNHNMGIVVNDERLEAFKAGRNKIVIVSGASRGGTSLVAYALRRCGVGFGDVDPRNHEPVALLEGDRTKAGIRTFLNELRTIGPLVGAKFPDFTFHLSWMDRHLEDTLFIHVVRNPLDTSKTIMARSPNCEFSTKHLVFGIKHATKYHNAFADAVASMKNPVMVLSYEAAKARPMGLLKLFSQLGVCSVPKDADDIVENIRAPGYKQVVQALS